MTTTSDSIRTDRYVTRGGVRITRTVRDADETALGELARALDARRGLLLASSYEYPGRYKRYDIGFVDPLLSLEAHGDRFEIQALQARGRVLLDACEGALRACPALLALACAETRLSGRIKPRAHDFAEEERTRIHSCFSVLRALIELFASPNDRVLGLYGAFGYDLVFQLEALTLRKTRAQDSRDLVLYLPDSLLVIDHERRSAQHLEYTFEHAGESTQRYAREPTPNPFVRHGSIAPAPARDHAPGEFAAAVERARSAFAAGELFEVTPSQTFLQPCAATPSAIFETLRVANPAPYGFLANLGGQEFLIGASPEMYVRVQADRVETCPIAGTIARGEDAFGDAVQILALLNSEKDAAELTMCTDVDRNDKARICEPGSVRVLGRRQIELYSRLIHTVDHVEGRLREGYDAIDALLTHMWAVTVTGAPKLAAMQFIEDHEPSPRGYYGGAIGALGFDGSLNTGLVLRTVHVRDAVAHVRAGATLHFDSDPDAEERECELKASALLGALARAAAASGKTAGAECATVQRSERVRSAAALRVLLIDHRDSFVHTLGDYFRQSGCSVTTLRHGFGAGHYARLDPELVVLSPGPGTPKDFAMRATLNELAARNLPVFGVCLGLQGMVEFCGGRLGQLATPVHGKASRIHCEPHPLFEGLPAALRVGRYHSLYAQPERLPSELAVLARADADGCIMAIGHRSRPWTAVQFHPESILSADQQHGLTLIHNVVAFARSARPHTSDSRIDDPL